jgi:hypothetical protein
MTLPRRPLASPKGWAERDFSRLEPISLGCTRDWDVVEAWCAAGCNIPVPRARSFAESGRMSDSTT